MDRQTREEGTVVTVPNRRRQVLLFLAPETGGDFCDPAQRQFAAALVFSYVRRKISNRPVSTGLVSTSIWTKSPKHPMPIPRARKRIPAPRANLAHQSERRSVSTGRWTTDLPASSQGSDQLVLDDTHEQSLGGLANLGRSFRSDRQCQFQSPLAQGRLFQPLCRRCRRRCSADEHPVHRRLPIHSRRCPLPEKEN